MQALMFERAGTSGSQNTSQILEPDQVSVFAKVSHSDLVLWEEYTNEVWGGEGAVSVEAKI